LFTAAYWIIGILVILGLPQILLTIQTKQIPYSEFKELLRQERVLEIRLAEDEIKGIMFTGSEKGLNELRRRIQEIEEQLHRESGGLGRWKFLVGGVIIVALAAYLVVTSLGSSGAYYLTIGEVKSKASTLRHRNVRVAGKVIGESIRWDAETMNLGFTMRDETGTLEVRYHGPRPDNLEDGADAVVEGRLGNDGVFLADNLLLKCPSRYESDLELREQQ